MADEFTESGFDDKPDVIAPPVKDANGENIAKNVESEISKQLNEKAPEAAKTIEEKAEAPPDFNADGDVYYSQLKEMVDNIFLLLAELAEDENLKNTPAETETLARVLYRYSPILKSEVIDSLQFILVIGKKLIRAKATVKKIRDRLSKKQAK
jgi:hypothetical protein